MKSKSASSDNRLSFSKRDQLKTKVFDTDQTTDDGWLELQIKIEEYLLTIPDIVIIRIPDIILDLIAWARMPDKMRNKVHEWLSGIPDWIILKQNNDFFCSALCLEAKAAGRQLRSAQRNIGNIIPVHIVRSKEGTKKLVEQFLGE